MKTFVPGEIARAEDVNANFAELKAIADKLTAALQVGHVYVSHLQPGGATTYYKVEFPKRFDKAPLVFMQSQNQRLNTAAWDITPRGFTWMAHNNTSETSAETQIMWAAISL
nr:MAG TPA: H-type lectin domain [Caudoviricetes sp.]